ncbi:MAG TPA: protease, partial [Gemmatimonadetes bacterium]|nr:protease [Gemmatimonadota bacterium]
TMNLWSMTSDGGDVRQHTRHSGWDVRNPALEGGRIVYELAADLRLYDIASGDEHLVPITLSSDFDQLREKWVDDPMQYLSSAHLDAEGERLVLTARGRVFVAPVGAGRIVRASNNDGARYRDVVFLPNGETLVGLSDESGEMEWVTLQANGTSEGRSITGDGTIQRRSGLVSPDGRWLAYDDNNADLWILDLQSGAQTLVSEDREGFGGSRSWSPDSRWLAFGKAAANTFVQIVLYSVDSGASVRVTSDRVNSTSPAWGPNGEFLYFLSDRNLQSLVGSPWGSRQPEPYFDRQMEIYQVSLRPGLRSPFQADDELTADDGDEAEDEAMDHDTVIDIELDGLPRRTKRVPIRAGNFAGLTVNDGALFFLDRDAGSRGGRRLTAVAITSEEPELVTVAENVGSYELSANGEKMLLGQGNNLYVIDARAAAAGGLAKHRVDLSDWAFPIDVREDFREIFIDLWRQERDWFYDPAMHGVEWDDVRDKYLALVDRVTTRDELSDVIGRVVGELSALHTSVRGGDVRTGNDNVPVASLGARIARTSEGDLIEYIYQSDPDYPEEMSPLADPDLGVSAGDLIQAVNGIDVLSEPHIGALLRNPGGDPVRLRLRSTANGTSREVMVTPTMGARALRYSDWEYTRRMDVEERGEGDIGYVHLQAMGGGDLTAWYRQFYPVFNRQGLIIDVRQNRGGNIDSFILEKLMRQAWMYFKGRTGEPTWNMQYAFRGHMVVLMDQTTASDGEAFADGFRRLGLGEVIGMRSWGGEIWLSNNTRASDGGLARTPQSGVYGPEGEWLIEQIGLVPDIVVDNLPHATFNGEDAQLDAAIRHLQQKIADDPRPVPPP